MDKSFDPFRVGAETAVGTGSVGIMVAVWRKLFKRDCTNCEPIKIVNAKIDKIDADNSGHRKLLVRMAHKMGIDEDEVEKIIK